jgi:hypothetical protein
VSLIEEEKEPEFDCLKLAGKYGRMLEGNRDWEEKLLVLRRTLFRDVLAVK